MTVRLRLLAALIFGITGVFLTTHVVQASDFTAEYQVDYTLNPQDGTTHVKQQVSLINQQPNLRASSYSLTLDSDQFTNLRAYDQGGALAIKEDKKEDSTTITFTFNDRVVGVGNALRWTIEYDSPSLAKQHGQIWDITVPRVEEQQSYNITKYTARLLVPESVGEAHYISPSAEQVLSDNGYKIYTFSKDLVFPAGIVAAFGKAQMFDFTLKYHLHNPNLGQAYTEIALPPDIPGQQQIIYDKLAPAPSSIRTDADGNTLATYLLSPNQNLDVIFTGWAKIDATYPDLDSPKLISDIPKDLRDTYTVSQKYWETHDAELIKKVKELTDSKKPAVENARAIYDYVTSTLQYNTARINEDLERMGGAAAFRDPKNAVCMEFTDLFITMARIAGIPAREIDGYAYTTDSDNHPIFYPGLGSDILHAWAQVYLPDEGWIMVDPTWGSTTGGIDFFGRMDLNRIAFAIRGTDSQKPYAAGSYKTNAEQDGDVNVVFSKEVKQGQADLDVSMDREYVVAGIGSNIPFTITNNGNVAIYNVTMEAKVDSPLALKDNEGWPKFARILPGQTATAWIPLDTHGWFDSAESDMTLTLSSTSFNGQLESEAANYTIHVKPFYAAILMPVSLLIIAVIAIIVGAWYGLHRWHNRSIVLNREQTSSNIGP